jgi:hypothetical protein
LVLLIALLPVFDRSKAGQQWFSIVNRLVLVTSLVAIGRSRYSLLVAPRWSPRHSTHDAQTPMTDGDVVIARHR